MATQLHTARAIGAGVLTAVVFEAFTLLATQDKTVRATSPWQDDPFNVPVSVAIFTVPVLAVVVLSRLAAWRLPGSARRGWQLRRATATMVGIVGGTVAFEWAAVTTRQHRASWSGWTAVLVAGLVATTLLAVATIGLLLRSRTERPRQGEQPSDWLDDVVVLARRVPLAGPLVTPANVAWVRRHAMVVFASVSTVAALGVIGALAVAEGWTDPALFGWAVAVEATSNLAFCVLSNHVAGFIARPPRSPGRRRVEAAVVAGCIAVQLAVAFRDVIWQVVSRPAGPTTVGALAVLTLSAGVAAGAVTALLWPPHVLRDADGSWRKL